MDHEIHGKVLYKDECYEIQGAIFDVYKEMGCGFLEAVYQNCLEIELNNRKIPFETQKEVKLFYKNELLKIAYVPDIICFDKIIIELKAVHEITTIHQAQLLNYLNATSLKLGLLVNFGSHPKAQIMRIIK